MNEKVLEFAKKYDYDGFTDRGNWRRFHVYEPYFNQPSMVGLPYVIIVDGDKIRFSTEEETFAFLRERYPSEYEDAED